MSKALTVLAPLSVFSTMANPTLSLLPAGDLQRRDEIIERAQAIERVAGESSNQAAMNVRAELASFATQLEDWRVQIKKPFFDAGKRIDADAKKFGEMIETERARLKKLCDAFAAEQARIAAAEAKRQADELARLQEERRKAEEQLRLAQEAEASRLAEEARVAALPPEEAPLQVASAADAAPGAIELEAAPQVARPVSVAAAQEAIMACDLKAVETLTSGVPTAPIKAEGQRTQKKWRVTVDNPAALYKAFPLMCDVVPKMREVNKAITQMAATQHDVAPSLPGCTVTEEYDTSPTRR